MSLAFLFSCAAFGQVADPTNIAAIGGSWDQSASSMTSQQFAMTAMYARKQTQAGTYAFTVLDVVPTSVKPITFTTQTSVGLGQCGLHLGSWNLCGTAAAGPSWTGNNAGWAWTWGGMAKHSLGKHGWMLMPNVRVIRSSVNNRSGSQMIVGALFGFGK
jgi:hypothetical protein